MSNNPPDQEPSIEEILSSIRQIISDDDEDQNENIDADEEEAVVEDPIHHERDDVLELSEEDLIEDKPEKIVEEPVVEAKPEPEIVEEVIEEPIEAPNNLDDNLDNEIEIEMRDKIEEELENIRNAIENEEPAAMTDNDHDERSSARPVPSDILSSGAQSAALGSLSKLASKMPINSSRSYDGVTLEDIVREMLHPMMREWMDDNLPPMVERIVQREIEKLARRAMDDY